MLLADSVTLFRDIGDQYGLAMALRIRNVLHTQGDVTRYGPARGESCFA